MRLNEILKKLNLKINDKNYRINHATRIVDDIKPNTLFFSINPLTQEDLSNIRKLGAVYIIGESDLLCMDYQKVLSIKKTYQQYLLFHNKKKLKNKIFIGVTGTNGKTQCYDTLAYITLYNKKKIRRKWC